MKKIFTNFILYFLILNWVQVNAQWTKINGPNMSTVRCATKYDSKIYVGAEGGIFSSSDEGMNWELSNPSNNFDNAIIYDIVPFENSLYAIAGRGIYIKNNSISDWTIINDQISISSFAIIDDKMFGGNSYGGGVFRSIDKGKSWEEINLGLSNKYVKCLTTDGNKIYAGTESSLFVSNDFGESWISIFKSPWGAIRSLKIINNKIYAGTYSGLYCSSDQGITWSRIEKQLSTVNSIIYDGIGIYALSPVNNDNSKVFYSTDGGLNWSEISLGLEEADVLCIENIDNKIYVGTNIGIYLLSKSDFRWIDLNTRAFLLASTNWGIYTARLCIQQQGLAMIGSNLIANGTFGIYLSSDNGLNWKYKQFNNGAVKGQTYPQCLKVIGNSIYVGISSNNLNQSGVYKSTDNGDNWIFSNKGIENKSVKSITEKDNIIFVATNDGVYKSLDHGANWISSSYGLNVLNVKQIVSADKYLYTGTDGSNEGGIFRSSDNGETWINIHPCNRVVDISADGSNVISVIDNNLIFSSDYGKTWNNIVVDGNLENHVSATEIKGRHIFVGTEMWYWAGEIFYSSDIGNYSSWEDVSNGVFNQPEILDFFINGDDVFALTTSGIYFRNDLKTNSKKIEKNDILSIFPNPASDAVTFNWQESSNVMYLEIFNTNGQKVLSKTVINNNPISIKTFNEGIYFYRLSNKGKLIHAGKLIVN